MRGPRTKTSSWLWGALCVVAAGCSGDVAGSAGDDPAADRTADAGASAAPGSGTPAKRSAASAAADAPPAVRELAQSGRYLEPYEGLDPDQPIGPSGITPAELIAEHEAYIDAVSACDPCAQSAQCSAPSDRFAPIEAAFVRCGGELACDRCEITLAGGLRLLAARMNLEPIAGQHGVRVHDRMRIPTAAGELQVFGADLEITAGASGPRLAGSAFVPAPELDFVKPVVIDNPAQARIGYDLGAAIDVGVPLQPDRHYFYFDFDTGFSGSAGPLSFEAPIGASATFLLDPSDPFFYVSGALLDSGSEGSDGGERSAPEHDRPREDGDRADREEDHASDDEAQAEDDEAPQGDAGDGDYGFGISVQGFVPFAPQTTWGIEHDIEGFDGHLIQTGTVPFGQLPVELRGLVITDLDPDQDGDTPFSPEYYASPDLQLGGNGELYVAVPFLKFFSFEWYLGQASAAAAFGRDKNQVYLSGVIDPEDPRGFMPGGLPMPIEPSVSLAVAGYLGDDIEHSFLRAEGEYAIDTREIGRALGLELGAVHATRASLLLDKNGLRLTGKTDSQICAGVAFEGEMEVELFVSADGLSSYIALRGAMTVAGQGLQHAELKVGPRGLFVNGTLIVGGTGIGLAGSIDADGPQLSGSGQVAIPFTEVDAAEVLRLAAEIQAQTGVVTELAQAAGRDRAAVESARRDVEAASAELEAAQREVDRIDVLVERADAALATLNAALSRATDRRCGVSYGGCPRCSSCNESCGTLDVACYARVAACQTERQACLVARAACGAANATACAADRAADVLALSAQIAAKQSERLALIAARETASGALAAAQLSLDAVYATLGAAQATLEVSEAALGAASQGLARLQDERDHLPELHGELDARIVVTLDRHGVRSALEATFAGYPVADGHVTLARPAEACFRIPEEAFQGQLASDKEFCASL